MILALLLGCIGNRCDETDPLPDADIVAIGDSILAWNASQCQSIVDHTSVALGERIDNRAVNGAQLQVSIPWQLGDSDASTVLITGGGNDLNAADACKKATEADVDAALDALATEDGTAGAMPDLVTELTDEGRLVFLLGYYGVRRGGWYGLGACSEEVEILKDRYVTLASLHPDVVFVDLEDTIQSDDKALYAFDAVHPSPKGAEAIGPVLAEALRTHLD